MINFSENNVFNLGFNEARFHDLIWKDPYIIVNFEDNVFETLKAYKSKYFKIAIRDGLKIRGGFFLEIVKDYSFYDLSENEALKEIKKLKSLLKKMIVTLKLVSYSNVENATFYYTRKKTLEILDEKMAFLENEIEIRKGRKNEN